MSQVTFMSLAQVESLHELVDEEVQDGSCVIAIACRPEDTASQTLTVRIDEHEWRLGAGGSRSAPVVGGR